MQIPQQFIEDVQRLFALGQRFGNYDHGDQDGEMEQAADDLVMRLESALVIIEESIQLLHGTQYHGELQLLNRMRLEASRSIRRIMYGYNDCTIPAIATQPFRAILRLGLVGRPRLLVNIEQAEFLRSTGYTWNEVAQCLQVSRSTLWRRMREMNVSLNRYSDISDVQLDDLVSTIQQQSPNIGQVMMQGFLEQRGVHVQRYRIRESIARTDPLRRSLRWHEAVSRRTYSVKGANSLWHIDGHHSLIRWRFVVHGCIDGYSRLIVFLNCNTNNKASTVYQEFRKATDEYGVPSRVRSDRGGENMQVCYFMVAYRGPDRASHIAGSSVHNQRIERLWRDVYRCVCSTYHEVFYEMEALEILNPDNELDLFVLHCVYLPKIRWHLQEFSRAWNVHPLRTERNWSPRKIWTNSVIRDTVDTSFNLQDSHTYGIDLTAPLPDEDLVTVDVPDTVSPLSGDQLEQFLASIDTQSVFEDYGVAHFIDLRRLLDSMLNESD